MSSLTSIGVVAFCLVFVTSTHAALVNTAGSFDLSGTNFPVDFGPEAVPLDGLTHAVAAGALSVQAEVIPIDVNSEFLRFNFNVASGAIAGNVNARWDFLISGIDYTEPVLFDQFFYYWTVEGDAVPNIQDWAGGVVLGPNPIDPLLGDVFGGTADPPATPFDPSLFISPFNLISTSQVGNSLDPNTVNDFHVAFRLQRVPEPSAFFLLSLVGVAIGGRAYWRRQNA